MSTFNRAKWNNSVQDVVKLAFIWFMVIFFMVRGLTKDWTLDLISLHQSHRLFMLTSHLIPWLKVSILISNSCMEEILLFIDRAFVNYIWVWPTPTCKSPISRNKRNVKHELIYICTNNYVFAYTWMVCDSFPQRKWCPQRICSSLRSQIRKSSWPGQARLEMSQVTELPSCPSMSPALRRRRWLCPSAKTPTLKCRTWSPERCIASTSTPSTTGRKVYRWLGNKPQVSARISRA